MVLAALDTVIKTHAIINLQISDAYGNHAIHYNSQLSRPKGKLKQKQNSTKSQKIITINTEDYKDIKKYGLSHYQHVEPKQLPSKKEKIPVLKRGPRLKIKKPLSSDSDEYVPPKIVAKSFEGNNLFAFQCGMIDRYRYRYRYIYIYIFRRKREHRRREARITTRISTCEEKINHHGIHVQR